MRIIENGKMTRWFETFLILFGFLFAYLSFVGCTSIFAMLGLWCGLLIAAIGGYSAQAKTLKIKSFGNLMFPNDTTKTKNIIKILESVINKTQSLILVLSFILFAFWQPFLKPYLEIYIVCVTIFVGFVAMVVVFIVVQELTRILKAKKSSKNSDQ